MTGQHPRAIGQKLKRAGRFRNRLAGFQFHDSLFRCNDAAAKHRNVDTGGWTLTLSRTEEREREGISPRNIYRSSSVSPFRWSCLKIAEAESINSWKISELVRCNWPDKPSFLSISTPFPFLSIDFLFPFFFLFLGGVDFDVPSFDSWWLMAGMGVWRLLLRRMFREIGLYRESKVEWPLSSFFRWEVSMINFAFM